MADAAPEFVYYKVCPVCDCSVYTYYTMSQPHEHIENIKIGGPPTPKVRVVQNTRCSGCGILYYRE